MTLPLKQPYLPMEAKSVEKLPSGDNWQYEPKWDGFRCIAFRDGDRVDLQSKSGQPLARYFPEVGEALLTLKTKLKCRLQKSSLMRMLLFNTKRWLLSLILKTR